MTKQLIEEVHNSLTGTTHGGFEKTYTHLSGLFYWPHMTKEIRAYIATCPVCQKIKHTRHLSYGLLQLLPIPLQPFKVVTMDFIGDLPQSKRFKAIFILVCKLTKYVFFIPCTTSFKEEDAACLFFNIVTHVRLPKQIISN
jgi:hypothetical protein